MKTRWVCLAVLLCSVVALLASQAQDTGQLQVRVGFERPDGSRQIQNIPLESYVAQVVAGEGLRGSQPAALEALAIAIRTFALANATRHRSDGFDLCDQTHCQVLRPATPATVRAADATAGRVLLRGNTPAQIFFSASCGSIPCFLFALYARR